MAARAFKIALVVFALGLGTAAVAVFLMGEEESLPFEYEGFD